MNNIKKFYKKLSNSIFLKILVIIVPFIISFLIETYHYKYSDFSIERFVLYTLLFEFIMIHLIFNIKKIWDSFYKFRYVIGLIIFSILVIGEYHGSSIGMYNLYIEPETVIESSEPIIGENRGIRSDEWMVGSMNILSQSTPLNNFNKYNNTMMGKSLNVNFYPKLPTKSISIITVPQMIGFLILPLKQAFSFYWFFNYFVLFFAAFEFFMILTKKNKKWSLVGALMILFAPAVQWWEATTLLYSGMLVMVFFNKFLNSKKMNLKILYSLLIGLCGSIYIMNLYPAWMVPYGYFFLGIVIWQLISNKDKYKLRDLLMLILIVILVISSLIIPSYLSSKDIFELMNNTVYPGARISVGGDGWEMLYNYILGPFLPYSDFSNASEFSQFLSFYPIPLILGVMYLINNKKDKKNDVLLTILVILVILLSIWNFIEIPEIISKLTLLSYSTSKRSQVIVGFIMNIILIYCLSNYENNKCDNKYLKFVIAFSLTLFGTYVILNNIPEYSKNMYIISIVIFTIICYLILINTKKYNNYLAILLSILAIICGIKVHPLVKGIDVIYEKPVAKEIHKIVNKDSNALWASVNDFFVVNNYLLANGAKTLNSTNYYPNYNLWNVIDPNKNFEQIWNRYSHVNIVLTKDNTNVGLLTTDSIALYINSKNVCDIGIDYFISSDANLESFSDSIVNIKNLYAHENMFIYDIKCS